MPQRRMKAVRARFVAFGSAALAVACLEGLPPDLPQWRAVARPTASRAEAESPPLEPAPPAEPVLVPQTGHVSQVWSVAFHPNGRFLASGGFDHTLGIWNLDGGLMAQLTGHHEALKRVAWSADGRVLASIARDSRIIVWDLARFAPKLVIEHPGFDLALSADGKRIFTVGPKAELSVYDATTGKLLDAALTPNGEGRQLLGVALSADGQRVATASLDGVVHIWDARKLAVRSRVAARTWRVAFGPDGRLAVPSGDSVLLVDPESGKTLRKLEPGKGVAHVAWSNDGKRLFAGVGTHVAVIDVASGKVHARHPVGILEALAASPDGTLLATGNDDPQVRTWRADSGAPVKAFGSPWGEVGSASFDPKGERIATGAALWIDLWDARTGHIVHRLRGKKKAPGPPKWSPDGTLVAASVADGAVAIWDAASGAQIALVEASTKDDWGPRFAFSPDSRRLAMFAGQSVSVWERGKPKVTRAFSLKLSQVADLAWRGAVVAVGGSEGVELLDPSTWKPLRHLDMKQLVPWGRVESLELSPDGQSLVTASSQHVLRWDVGSGQLVARTAGRTLHADPVSSPDGSEIAFPNMQRGVSLWSARGGGGVPFEILHGDSAVRQIRWSPDGKRLAVASDDNAVRVVEVATKKLERTLAGHESRIWSLGWHPSGEVLLSASHQARLHALSDGRVLTLRARFDRKAGLVHSGDGYFAGVDEARELVRFRVGGDLPHASLVAPEALPVSREKKSLLDDFWRR